MNVIVLETMFGWRFTLTNGEPSCPDRRPFGNKQRIVNARTDGVSF